MLRGKKKKQKTDYPVRRCGTNEAYRKKDNDSQHRTNDRLCFSCLYLVGCSNDAVKLSRTFVSSFLCPIADNLSNVQSGSSLSLASAATNEADSINSGGAGSQRYALSRFIYICMYK